MLRSIVLAFVLALTTLPAASSEEATPALPAWLAERLAANGIAVDAADLVVERTIIAEGARTTFVLPLSALPAEDPFGGSRVAPAEAPDALVGQLTFHTMLQVASCAGYGAQEVAAGVSAIQDASWDIGVHVALGPLAGGVAASTSGDPVTNAVVILGEDFGMDVAAGELWITEDRVTLFGVCIVTLGTMTGTGAWVFS